MGDLKLEAGKFYKTRDGRKAFVSAVELPHPVTGAQDQWPVRGSVGDLGFKTWRIDGSYALDHKISDLDLVAPWREEPKFKVGDRVRRPSSGKFGCILKVIDCFPQRAAYDVSYEEDPRWAVRVLEENLELAPPKPEEEKLETVCGERDNWKAQALDATAECNALAAKVKELEQELSCEEALVLMWSSRALTAEAKLQAFEDQKIRDSNYAQGVVKERDVLAARVAQWEQAFEQERAEKKELGMERNELQHKVARVEAALAREEDRLGHGGRTLEEAIRDAINPPAAPGKKRVKGFVNVYGAAQYTAPGAHGLYSSREDANRGASGHRIACIETDVEEGTGL